MKSDKHPTNRPLVVKIRDIDCTLQLRGDVYDSLADVARFVDDKMAALERQFPLMPPVKIALLVALNIANDLFLAEKERGELLKKLDEKTRHLSGQMEDLLRES